MTEKAMETRKNIDRMLDLFDDEKSLKRIYTFVNRLYCGQNPSNNPIGRTVANYESLTRMAAGAECIGEQLTNLAQAAHTAHSNHPELFMDMIGREVVHIARGCSDIQWALKAMAENLNV